MELISTTGWNHRAINRKGLRDIWFRDKSDIYIIYLDNSNEPETCRIARFYQEPEGCAAGSYTLEKKDAEAFLERLGDGSRFIDTKINLAPEHRDEHFHLNDIMERIFLAMEYYQEQRRN